jgi:hypothetical protein
MKVQGISEKASRFEGANFGLPLASENGVLFRIIEIDNWLRVMIEVDEDTTSKDVRRAIPLALEWRDRLLQWQGPWLQGNKRKKKIRFDHFAG